MRLLVFLVILVPSALAWCRSSCCSSHCYCSRCSSAPCRMLGVLEERYLPIGPENSTMLMEPSDPMNQSTNMTIVEENPLNQNQRRATCECLTQTPNYCCSEFGYCGLGIAYGAACAGMCDLAFPCPEGQCCSKNGWCGTGSAYCDYPMSACNYKGYSDGNILNYQDNSQWCGYGQRGNGRCKSAGFCCSKYGYCDYTTAHCKSSNQYVWQPNRGGWRHEKLTGTTTYCGDGTTGNGQCPASDSSSGIIPRGLLCCSPNGYCGNINTDPKGAPFCGV